MACRCSLTSTSARWSPSFGPFPACRTPTPRFAQPPTPTRLSSSASRKPPLPTPHNRPSHHHSEILLANAPSRKTASTNPRKFKLSEAAPVADGAPPPPVAVTALRKALQRSVVEHAVPPYRTLRSRNFAGLTTADMNLLLLKFRGHPAVTGHDPDRLDAVASQIWTAMTNSHRVSVQMGVPPVLAPDAQTYELLLGYFALSGNVVLVRRALTEMNERGITAKTPAVRASVAAAHARAGEDDVADEFLAKFVAAENVRWKQLAGLAVRESETREARIAHVYGAVVQAYSAAGNHKRMVELVAKMMKLNVPTTAGIDVSFLALFRRTGQVDRAIALLDSRAKQLESGVDVALPTAAWNMVLETCLAASRTDEAKALLNRMEALGDRIKWDPSTERLRAQCFAQMGDEVAAWKALIQSVELAGGFPEWTDPSSSSSTALSTSFDPSPPFANPSSSSPSPPSPSSARRQRWSAPILRSTALKLDFARMHGPLLPGIDPVRATLAKAGVESAAAQYFALTTLMDGYSRRGDHASTAAILHEMQHSLARHVDGPAHELLISAYLRAGELDVACRALRSMRKFGLKPSRQVFASVLRALAATDVDDSNLDGVLAAMRLDGVHLDTRVLDEMRETFDERNLAWRKIRNKLGMKM
ncbi:hypothetical protein BDK51DRAFT_47786 [Blyttiomyces helicus]|uniref:Pentacotripeptide-repeat region of PRORP domain-containing protein n=1 Tax=Blyttiomyces helicus TaxID=388810 RepID=A0A4P9W6E2_9FUNG|nr:hypothetical protein BDK51DRAFT_47786 [Blyttiomyces helicus]|eukprot:RKO86498.1 hypothetical protein BDK51DRAFT_47786 [Blyttiomyces helicus]